MSAETKAALDAAIAAHVADETDGGMLLGYVMQTEYTSTELLDEDSYGYLRLVGEGQTLTQNLGLWHYGSWRMERHLEETTS